MIYNTAELDDMPSVETYTKEPTWVDTFQAATKNFTSVSLSSSELSYFTEERDKNMEEWKTKDPENKSMYDRYGTMPKGVLDKLEVLYEDGNIDAIKEWNQAMPGRMSTGEVFLKFKELQGLHGFKGYAEFNQNAKDKSLKDFQESQEVIANSGSLSAELLGTMYGALHDPITLATLPLGGWSSGRGVMMNAARAFGQEAMIETGVQAIIAPTVYSYKKEIGLKTSILTEAYNAVAAILTAGLFRGAGSAAFDLSAKGMKALKVKDPELAADYANFAKNQPTQDLKTHVDNMQKVEFSGEPLTEIKTPNEKGVELNEAKVISEVDEDLMEEALRVFGFEEAPKRKAPTRAEEIKEAAEPKIGGSEEEAKQAVKEMFKKPLETDARYKTMSKEDIAEIERMAEEDMRIVVDKDIEGEVITRSYKEINQEFDDNDIMFKRIQDCILGVK